MTFKDKLYELRKKNNLSQEALADKLNVSRQAISKWENGQAVPESEKLILISEFFDVSLDYLLKDGEETITVDVETAGKKNNQKLITGLILCIFGIVSMIVWGLMFLLNPKTSDQIGASSVITIDGNGIFLTVCVIVLIAGAVLLLKKSSRD